MTPHQWEVIRGLGQLDLAEMPPAAREFWNYYTPLQRKLPQMEARFAGDKEAAAVLQFHRREIAMFREHADCYGYVFFIARRR
jgi:hypothetical protein